MGLIFDSSTTVMAAVFVGDHRSKAACPAMGRRFAAPRATADKFPVADH
jgi:hypothetical protein